MTATHLAIIIIRFEITIQGKEIVVYVTCFAAEYCLIICDAGYCI